MAQGSRHKAVSSSQKHVSTEDEDKNTVIFKTLATRVVSEVLNVITCQNVEKK